MHPDWIVPDWPAPACVRAVCTTRAGGVSSGPYASLNLGDQVGDVPAQVMANWSVLSQSLPARLVLLNQVHGATTVVLQPDTPDGVSADACVAEQPGLVCTIRVADCLPVLLADCRGRRVAAAHAGWRGLLGQHRQGILESVVARFVAPSAKLPNGIAPADVCAWLGPCIGPDAFQVGQDVLTAFVRERPESARFFRPEAKHAWLADLPALARQQLKALGINHIHGNDGSAAWCTVRQPLRFFSHRRDRISGRMAACIGLV